MNLIRRKQITLAVVDHIGRNLNNPLLSDPRFIEGIFDGACNVLKVTPSERDRRLILERVYDECGRRMLRAAQSAGAG